MHQWSDIGIIISIQRHGEQSAIVRLLTETHGIQAGMVKGAFSKKARGIYQPGNKVHANWQARLEEQLGYMHCELLFSCTAQLLDSPLALKLMNAASALVTLCVPEKIEEKLIYIKINILIYSFDNIDKNYLAALEAYAQLEFTLLHALGFGMDVSQCVATGIRDKSELLYVSPKSGCAVSRNAGEPYKAKLLPLPAFFLGDSATPGLRQLLDGLALTGYFLERWVLHPEGRQLPEARARLMQHLRAMNS